MLWVRLYLLAGLVAHKLVWEVLKRRQRAHPAAAPARPAGLAALLRPVKMAILGGLLAQTVMPEVWPIAADPGSLRLAGVALYTLGLAVAIAGRVQLGENWADIEAAQVLQQQAVVATGLYRFIRHPIYAGDLIMLVGFELALNSWLVLGVAALAPYVLWRAVREERMLSARLPGYGHYCARTYRFVPFVI
jgi:protein-S-isoprenylcysteine O-methyltransferase Ste14